MNIERTIWITFQKEGIHSYPAALEAPHLNDVKFLGYPHRHIFYFRVEVPVSNSNREIEFIQFKRYCENLYKGDILQLYAKSCEMIAETLATQIIIDWKVNRVIVSVSEDNENGSTVTVNA